MFIDSHAHLEGHRFDSDREQVITRARESGVDTIVAIGNGDGPVNFDCGIQLAEKYEFIYATIGIHPHEAKLADQAALCRMEQLARHPKIIAWGEIGLDYFYDHSPRDVQREAFIRQMELARTARLPIVIHCRPSDGREDAWDDCLHLIQQHWAPAGIGGILHCFTGNSSQIRDAALEVPLDRMLIETDSPFLAPVPYRGKRNEPAYVKEVARQLGELRGLSMEEIGRQTTQNFYRFFSLHEKRVTV